MTMREAEAVRLLGAYTAGTFRVWDLMGPARASCRAHIASTLAGRRVPQAKAGVNVLTEQFAALAGIGGLCQSGLEDAVAAWARRSGCYIPGERADDAARRLAVSHVV